MINSTACNIKNNASDKKQNTVHSSFTRKCCVLQTSFRWHPGLCLGSRFQTLQQSSGDTRFVGYRKASSMASRSAVGSFLSSLMTYKMLPCPTAMSETTRPEIESTKAGLELDFFPSSPSSP